MKMTPCQKRCADCAECDVKHWKCNECFGQSVEDVDECPLGITIEEVEKDDLVYRTLEINQMCVTANKIDKRNNFYVETFLNDFNLFAIFKHDDLFYYSLFERTSADDPLDDYSASHPVIA